MDYDADSESSGPEGFNPEPASEHSDTTYLINLGMGDDGMGKVQEDEEDFVEYYLTMGFPATPQLAVDYPLNNINNNGLENPKTRESLDKRSGDNSAPSPHTKSGILQIFSDLITRSISLPEVTERGELPTFQDVPRLLSVLRNMFYNPFRWEDKMLPISQPRKELETPEPPVAMFLEVNNDEDYLIPMSLRDRQLQLLKCKKLVKVITESIEKSRGRPISMFVDGDPFPPYITPMGFGDRSFRLGSRRDRKEKIVDKTAGLGTAKKRGKPLKKFWKELQYGPSNLLGDDQEPYIYYQQHPWNSRQRRGCDEGPTNTLPSWHLKQAHLGLERSREASSAKAPRCTGKVLRVIKSLREPDLMRLRTKLGPELSRWPTLQALIERQIVFVTPTRFRIGSIPGDSRGDTWLHDRDFINQIYGVMEKDVKAAGYRPTGAKNVGGNSTIQNIDSLTLPVQGNNNTDNGIYIHLPISLPRSKRLWQAPRSNRFSHDSQGIPAGIGGASALGLRGGAAIEDELSEDSSKNLITKAAREEEQASSRHRSANELERPGQTYQIGSGELRASSPPLRNPFDHWEVDEELEEWEELEAPPDVPLWKAMIDVIFSMWKGLGICCLAGLGGDGDYQTEWR